MLLKNFDDFDLFISLKRHINKLNQLRLESQVQILQTNEMKINGNNYNCNHQDKQLQRPGHEITTTEVDSFI